MRILRPWERSLSNERHDLSPQGQILLRPKMLFSNPALAIQQKRSWSWVGHPAQMAHRFLPESQYGIHAGMRPALRCCPAPSQMKRVCYPRRLWKNLWTITRVGRI